MIEKLEMKYNAMTGMIFGQILPTKVRMPFKMWNHR
jgi:hypothetical protein